MILLLIFLLLFLAYGFLILYYLRSWATAPFFSATPIYTPIPVSIIIPARNEQENIGRLLTALLQQIYPAALVQIIVVDDHSEDGTADIVRQYASVQLLSMKDDVANAYKKKAIEQGIAAATGELILTTDADCLPDERWLQTVVAFRERSGARFIVAPVVFDCRPTPVEVFQAMDFMVLQGITGASVSRKLHAMCNGANLAYDRALFYEVDGFRDIDHIASGDDMLLMQKVASRFPDVIHYLKSRDAFVNTRPMPNWRTFFNQRIRWASKAFHYRDGRIFAVLLLVYLFNLSYIVFLITGFFQPFYWLLFLLAWIAKTLVELPFFHSVAEFFYKRWALKWFFFFQPVHIVYTVVSGLFGQFGMYTWKGRRVK